MGRKLPKTISFILLQVSVSHAERDKEEIPTRCDAALLRRFLPLPFGSFLSSSPSSFLSPVSTNTAAGKEWMQYLRKNERNFVPQVYALTLLSRRCAFLLFVALLYCVNYLAIWSPKGERKFVLFSVLWSITLVRTWTHFKDQKVRFLLLLSFSVPIVDLFILFFSFLIN